MMGCLFGHDAYTVSTEILIKSPHFGFIFLRCKRCGKRRIDGTSFKGGKKGKWVVNWEDNGGIMPEKSLPDKYCPKCNKLMKKTTAFGGEWSCEPDPHRISIISMSDKEFHFETIEAKPEDYLEV